MTQGRGESHCSPVCACLLIPGGEPPQLSPPHPHPSMALLAQGTLGGPDGLREGGGRGCWGLGEP